MRTPEEERDLIALVALHALIGRGCAYVGAAQGAYRYADEMMKVKSAQTTTNTGRGE